MSARLPDVRTMLSELVGLPSISSMDPAIDQGNRAVAERLADWLATLGFEVELMPVLAAQAKCNLIARRGSGPGGLVLAGHADTVPCDLEAWDTDPFRLTERDGRLYGLGSSDMKSFFPLVLEALGRVPLERLQAPVTVIATADEESSMSGARTLAAREGASSLGRFALIGEPTGLQPVDRHKGVMMLAIRLTGRAGHASDPALGRSALDGMHAVLSALIAWRTELAHSFQDAAFAVPTPTVNFGAIHGGDNPNRICARCELQVDVRLLPGMSPGQVLSQLEAEAARAVSGSGLELEVSLLSEAVPPFRCPHGARLLEAAESLSQRGPRSVGFATEAPFFSQLGMETVVMGAGDIEVAHQANEYLGLERIAPMTGMLEKLLARFCLEPE